MDLDPNAASVLLEGAVGAVIGVVASVAVALYVLERQMRDERDRTEAQRRIDREQIEDQRRDDAAMTLHRSLLGISSELDALRMLGVKRFDSNLDFLHAVYEQATNFHRLVVHAEAPARRAGERVASTFLIFRRRVSPEVFVDHSNPAEQLDIATQRATELLDKVFDAINDRLAGESLLDEQGSREF